MYSPLVLLTHRLPPRMTSCSSSSSQQTDILSKSVNQFANMAVNLRSSMDASKKGQTLNDKVCMCAHAWRLTAGVAVYDLFLSFIIQVVEFLNQGDDDTLALADAVEAGETGAINELQQSFVNKYFPGLNLKALQDDDFVTASREFLANDDVSKSASLVCLSLSLWVLNISCSRAYTYIHTQGLQNLMNNDEATLSVLLDEDLLFANSPMNTEA